MKDGKTKIITSLDRHKSTLIREFTHNTSNQGDRPRQVCLLGEECSLGSPNASQIMADEWTQTIDCLLEQFRPKQIAHHVGIRYETIYHYFYADKVTSGSLYQQLRNQKSIKSTVLVVAARKARLWAQGRSVSTQYILGFESKSATGRVIL